MPVRGTTAYSHAIIQKKVINMDHAGDKHVMCAWDDCENDGYEMYMVKINYGKPASPHIVKHIFCSERHRQYFIHNTRNYGKLPAGMANLL